MDRAQVHFEVFARRQHGSSWSLELATEDRTRALDAAEEMLEEQRAISVKVTKETLDEDTREFKTVTILTKGEPDKGKAKKPREGLEPLCVSPHDLYTLHARDRIGRLLEGWLSRNRATPFELLHRPDLIEKLEATGLELQHAIQKVSIPEAQARGKTVHHVIRDFQKLVQATIDRVMRDDRKGRFPDFAAESFAVAAERLVGEPNRQYLLGGGIARAMSTGASWSGKVNRLLDLADQAPREPAARALAFHVLEQPLTEILGARAGIMELLGVHLDLGGALAAMTRLAAAESVDALISIEPAVAKVMPPLQGPAARLANWLDGPYFENVRTAIAHRVLKELTGPKRLRPNDAEGEIVVLRALAMALTAAVGRILTREEVEEAFVNRSRTLVRADFVEAFLGHDRSPLGEVEALLWLSENVTGAANKRQASRWVQANVSALRFETDLRAGPDSAATKLAALADLQRGVFRCGFVTEEATPIALKIGEVGGQIEADARLSQALAKAAAPVVNRLTLLLRLAAGETAPRGPAADRAKAEAMRLMRAPEIRAEIARSPDAVGRVRALMQTAGLAA
ncbi:MAG TPA: hypothetical protein VHZ26_06285 [Caulobacteraceae bacterium]|jgi:hypothetical protein|nr:hypothetical protein [Caulobacteraceae bacterium]